jgi:2-methylcitrate dehydratase PrpD
MNAGITATLSKFATGLGFDDLPDDVVSLAKHCVLDWLGVTIAGINEPLSRILVEQAVSEGGHPQATLIGDGRRVSVSQAALVNGAVSHALDFDDVQERLHGHPTAPIAPVLLALAERDGYHGRNVIAALVAGIEVECRINVFMGDSHYERGWHSTATNGSFGSAVGASHLFGFDARQCAWAMGVAGTQAAGLRAMFGTMAKPLHAGKAAANGLLAAELVKRGFVSRGDVPECELGYGHTQSERTNAGAALEGLGQGFEIQRVLFKYHAACHGVHATIEAIQELRRKVAFGARDVVEVQIELNPSYLNICGIENPQKGGSKGSSASVSARRWPSRVRTPRARKRSATRRFACRRCRRSPGRCASVPPPR